MIRPMSEKERAMEAFQRDRHAEAVARNAGFKDAMEMRAAARRWMRVKNPVVNAVQVLDGELQKERA